MTRVEALGGIVYDIFRLPVEREEALEGLARQNTPEAIDIIAKLERGWFFDARLRMTFHPRQ